MYVLYTRNLLQRNILRGPVSTQVSKARPGAPRFEAELFAGFFQEADDRFNAQLEVLEVEFFVGGVEAVVGQAEAHHDAGHAQIAIKIANDGDGAAGADKDCVFAPDLFEGASGGLDEGVVDADQAGVAGADQTPLDLDAGGSDLLDEALVECEGFGGSHAGNQAHGDLGDRLGGDDGFGA